MGFLGLGRRRSFGSGNPNADGMSLEGLIASAHTDSLLSAGYRVKQRDADQQRRLIQPWHARSFSYYDQLGEIWYASQFYARMLSLLRLYPAELNDDGEWEETEDPDAVEALARIRDPGGGQGDREGLLSAYGRLQFITGEAYLLCSVDADTKLEQWEMLSTDELRVQGNTYVRYRAPTMAAEDLKTIDDDDFEPLDEDTAVVYRLWRRHPRYTSLSDSPMRGVLDLCEELLLLTRAVRARARSRIAGNGILAISEDFSHQPQEPVPDDDIEMDPFLRDFREALLAPIANEGAASAVVPFIVRGSSEAVDKGIKHIQIVDPTQLYPETGLRYELIKRIALGLDMPPEILLGMTDANHWTGWLVDDQTWKAHGQPISNQLIGDLTTSYFLPELRSQGRKDWARFSIRYDASAVVNHPDRTKDAKDLYDRRAIGKAALRDAGGFDEGDAPTQDELYEQIGVAVRDGSLALFGIPSVKAGGLEPEPGEVVSNAGTAGTPEDEAAVTGAEVEKGPPEGNGGGEPLAVVGSALEAARVAGAADLAVRRARELAGSRLRSLAKRNPDWTRELDGVPNAAVAATLGRDRVRQLGVSERDLIAGVRAVLEETLHMWGIDDATRGLLVEQVERHSVRSLYEERPGPLPAQFVRYLDGVLARA